MDEIQQVQRDPHDTRHSGCSQRRTEASKEEIGDRTYVGRFRPLRDGDLEATESFLDNHPEAKFAEIYYVKKEHLQKGPKRINLFEEVTGDPTYLPLFRALRDGDLRATKNFLRTNPEAQSKDISPGKTAIVLAIQYGQVDITEWLLQTTPLDALEEELVRLDYTLLHVAVMAKNTKIAKLLVKKYPKLLLITNRKNRVPLGMACLSRQAEMVHYLYPMTHLDKLDNITQAMILNDSITGEFYDIALDILKCKNDLAIKQDFLGVYVLNVLAGKSSAFRSGSKLVFWQQWIYACIHIGPDLSESGREDRHEALNPMRAMLWKLLKRSGKQTWDVLDFDQLY